MDTVVKNNASIDVAVYSILSIQISVDINVFVEIVVDNYVSLDIALKNNVLTETVVNSFEEDIVFRHPEEKT